MKVRNRALLVSALALASGGLVASGAHADINVGEVKRAIVWVDVQWAGEVTVPFADGTTKIYDAETFSYCTGWVASDVGHVVTAGHCTNFDATDRKGLLRDVIENEKLTREGGFDLDTLNWAVTHEIVPTIRIGQPSAVSNPVFDNNGMTAQLLDTQDTDAGDNALVQVAGKATPGVALKVAAVTPKERDAVTSIGFPGDTASITEADRQSPTFKEGTISALTYSKKGVPQYQLDGELIGGMSGGPTLNAAGEVVGVNSSSFTGTNQSYVTDTATLRTFLDKNGVGAAAPVAPASTSAPAAQPAASSSDVKGESSNLLVIILLVVVAILVGAFVFVMNLLRKARTQAATPANTASEPAAPVSDGDDRT